MQLQTTTASVVPTVFAPLNNTFGVALAEPPSKGNMEETTITMQSEVVTLEFDREYYSHSSV